MTTYIRFIAGLLLLIGLALTKPSNAFSDENDKARLLIEKSSQYVYNIMTSQQLTEEQKDQYLAIMFNEIVDFPWMARFSFGRHWNGASDEQHGEYKRLNQVLLFKYYLL